MSSKQSKYNKNATPDCVLSNDEQNKLSSKVELSSGDIGGTRDHEHVVFSIDNVLPLKRRQRAFESSVNLYGYRKHAPSHIEDNSQPCVYE